MGAAAPCCGKRRDGGWSGAHGSSLVPTSLASAFSLTLDPIALLERGEIFARSMSSPIKSLICALRRCFLRALERLRAA